ncbi:hypothetical protein ACLOJK_031326 [Asimina triloba]
MAGWKEVWTLLPRGVDGQIWLEGMERADAAGHGRVAWSCLDWTVLLAGSVGGSWLQACGRRRRGGRRWVGRFGVAGSACGKAVDAGSDGWISFAGWRTGVRLLVHLDRRWDERLGRKADGGSRRVDACGPAGRVEDGGRKMVVVEAENGACWTVMAHEKYGKNGGCQLDLGVMGSARGRDADGWRACRQGSESSRRGRHFGWLGSAARITAGKLAVGSHGCRPWR